MAMLSSSHALKELTVTAAAPTAYSQVVGIGRGSRVGGTLWWTATGSGLGLITFWVTDKHVFSEADDADWVQLSGAAVHTAPAGTSSKTYFDIDNVNHRWLRIKVAHSSGTSFLIDGWITVKGE